VAEIYAVTSGFPASERYGLQSQLRRAAVSIVANIAEGARRANDKDFARFIHVAQGSLSELTALLLMSQDLGLVGETKGRALTGECRTIRAMLHGLARRLGS
jgi:four helix bundle protein